VGADADAATAIGVTRLRLYPMATQTTDDLAGGVDLAILETDADLPSPPLAIAPPASTDGPTGQPVTVVGYGRTQAFDSTSAGFRESITVPVIDSCTRWFRIGDDVENTCFGDSGGAVLRDGALFAIVSAGHDGCDTPSYATRLDAHRVWLGRVLAGDFDAPCPECVAPSSACDAPIELDPTTVAPATSTSTSSSPIRTVGGGACAISSTIARSGTSSDATSCLAWAMAAAGGACALRRGRRARRRSVS
jgi:hypothetical protein